MLAIFLFSIIAVAISSPNAVRNFDPHWLYSSASYAKLGVEAWYAGIYRLAIYMSYLIMSYCFLAFVPNTETYFSRRGRHTRYAYLLHGPIVLALENTPLIDFHHSISGGLLFITISILLTQVLTSHFIRSITCYVIEPNIKIVEKIVLKHQEANGLKRNVSVSVND